MVRREALKGITAVTLGMFLLQSCENEPSRSFININLQKGEWSLVDQFCNAILPINIEDKTLNENRTAYVLTMVDETLNAADRNLYIKGLQAIYKLLITEYNKSPQKMGSTELEGIIKKLMAEDANLDPSSFFINKTKSFLIKDYVTSEGFMTTQLDYKFLPGTYLGCSPIS